MKKVYYIILAMVFVFQSCKTIMPIETRVEHTKETIQSVVSKPIIDTIKVSIADVQTAIPQCDSITNLEIKKLLQRINASKNSGDNAVGFYYDEIKKLLVAYAKTGQSSTTNSTSTQVKTTQKPIIVKTPIPAWIKILALLGVGFLLFLAWRFSKIFRP